MEDMSNEEPYFTTSDTEGYTADELAELNAEFARRGGHELRDDWEREELAMRILKHPPDGIEPGA